MLIAADIDKLVDLFLIHGLLYGLLFVVTTVGSLAIGFVMEYQLTKLMARLRTGRIGRVIASVLGVGGVVSSSMVLFCLIEPLDKDPRSTLRAWILGVIMGGFFACVVLLIYWDPFSNNDQRKSEHVPPS